MGVSASELFLLQADEWLPDAPGHEVFDAQRVQAVIAGPEVGTPDVEFAVALMDVIRDDLTKSGSRHPARTAAGAVVQSRAVSNDVRMFSISSRLS
jgi:hypothetical protein